MAPATIRCSLTVIDSNMDVRTNEVARETRATWRHRHIGLKSAPQHRDFRPEKVERFKR